MKTKDNLSCTSLKIKFIEVREHHKNSNLLDHRIEIILDKVHGLETNLDSQTIDISRIIPPLASIAATSYQPPYKVEMQKRHN